MAWVSASKKLLYQTPSKPRMTGMFWAKGAVAEMLVHGVKPVQHLGEVLRADGQHQRAGRWPKSSE